MSDNFNGFSSDDIKKLSTGGKMAKCVAFAPTPTLTTTPTPPTTTPMLTGTIGKMMPRRSNGIRRMTEKCPRDNAKGKTLLAMQTSRSLTPLDGDIPTSMAANREIIDVIDVDVSMSQSLEDALYILPKNVAAHGTVNGTASLSIASNELRQHCIDAVAEENGNGEMKADAVMVIEEPTTTISSDLSDSSILCSIKKPTTTTTTTTATTTTTTTTSGNVTMNPPPPPPPFAGVSLKDFERHRRLVEEQNKQKKALLYRVIEQHSQKTAAEVRKMEEVKSELIKLDDDLAVDVAILRKQIDNACMHFVNIEKQYMKIESQFLKAKMELHHASEKKELLTEHLCTVIAHNEERKAQKLCDLMQKIGISPMIDTNLMPDASEVNANTN